MEFEFREALIREMANGTMAVSGLLLVVIFSSYCWKNRSSLSQNHTTQAAFAILILMIGHLIRAGGAWIEFFLLRHLIRLDEWLWWSVIWFVASAVLVLSGKLLMVYIFAPARWHRALIFAAIPTCVAVPLLLARFA